MLNAGLIVSKKAREILGDDLLKDVFEQARLTYVAESGDFLLEDVRANELKALVMVNEGQREAWLEDIDQKAGISPLAILSLPSRWFLGKTRDYSLSLLVGYSMRAQLMDLTYRVQPVRSASVSRRSVLKLKVYEYRPYPVLFDEVRAEREINKAVELCPQGLVVKAPEGPSVSSPEKCSACGYCSGSSYLGYLEVPNATTEQVVHFINALVSGYRRPGSVLFTETANVDVPEGVFPFLVPCTASVHDSFVLATYSAGFTPLVYASSTCQTRELALKRLEEMPDRFPGTQLPVIKARSEEELRKALIMTFPELPRSVIPESVSLQRSRRRSLLVWAVEEMSRKVKLNEDDDVPGVYNVVVDPNKCVLCGVCVRACQMLVPDLTGGEELALSYNIPYCIGSQRCVKNCPENAVSVPGLAKIRDLTRKVMNRGKVIKCRFCGKPIGSEKVKGRVDSMLITQGFQGTAQYTDVCNECKQKMLTKIWVERLLGGKK